MFIAKEKLGMILIMFLIIWFVMIVFLILERFILKDRSGAGHYFWTIFMMCTISGVFKGFDLDLSGNVLLGFIALLFFLYIVTFNIVERLFKKGY